MGRAACLVALLAAPHRQLGALLLRLLPFAVSLTDEWSSITLPSKSLFFGFPPPDSARRWALAVESARSGEQILLKRALQVVKVPNDLLQGEIKFNSFHRLADVLIHRKPPEEGGAAAWDGFFSNFSSKRAPIVMIGYTGFSSPDNFEGEEVKVWNYRTKEFLRDLVVGRLKLEKKRKFVAIGQLEQNWGFASSHFLNRTAAWGFSFIPGKGVFNADQTKELQAFLDHECLVMLVVNQHHNISHPKIISLPRGVPPNGGAKLVWDQAREAIQRGIVKNTLLFAASSNWGQRPEIIACVNQAMGSYMTHTSQKDPKIYLRALSTSYAVLAVPGLGYDTFRLWETLASGSMPVLERGVGLDRTLYRLPALLVDDFADVTPELIRQAYVEAVYRADSWDYRRITARYWERLIFKASETGTHEHMLRLHPLLPEMLAFARPLVPFACGDGGCGKGTRRVPKSSCAINPKTNMSKHNWFLSQPAMGQLYFNLG